MKRLTFRKVTSNNVENNCRKTFNFQAGEFLFCSVGSGETASFLTDFLWLIFEILKKDHLFILHMCFHAHAEHRKNNGKQVKRFLLVGPTARTYRRFHESFYIFALALLFFPYAKQHIRDICIVIMSVINMYIYIYIYCKTCLACIIIAIKS